ncbi:hypothetical protein HMPREF0379_1582 [[Eubacterium] yurii subsp. margaretiae ATCC 43715]|nr:hypothetical protein HMPREF0379_1582 [[Eubacterium] yurii subsp. margaretiae ATCC 43715]
MSAKVSAVIISLILSLVIIFQNSAMITMSFLIFTFSIHLGVLLFIAFLLGCILVFNLFSIREDSFKLLLKSKNRQIANLKKENSKINVVNFGKDVKMDSENEELYDKFKEAVKTESLSGDNYEDFEKKVDDYFTTNQSNFDYDDFFKTNNESQEEVDSNNIPLSSFDKETFSLKSSSNSDTSSDEANEPWYMKPFFKRGKKLEQTTIKVDVEESTKKKSLDDLIKLDLDDMSKNMGIKQHTKSSIADNIPALDNAPVDNPVVPTEDVKENIECQVSKTDDSETSKKAEHLEKDIKDSNIANKEDSKKVKDTKVETKEEVVKKVEDVKVNEEKAENKKRKSKIKSKKKSAKVKKNIKKLKIKSANKKSKQQISEQPISTANPHPENSNESLKEDSSLNESLKDEGPKTETSKNDNVKKSFFGKIKSFKIFPKGFNWRETFKADEQDDESLE